MTIAQNAYRIAAVLGLALAGVAVWAAGARTERIEVFVEAGAVVKPSDRVIRVTEGSRVELVFHSDAAGELHLHGYDVPIPLDPQAPRTVTIDARATGRYPVTSHGFGADAGRTHGRAALLFLEVHPR